MVWYVYINTYTHIHTHTHTHSLSLHADHVAVVLFLEHGVSGLTLYFPCDWVSTPPGFIDTGERDWRINPGATANRYHYEFTRKAGRDSLADIRNAIDNRAVADS